MSEPTSTAAESSLSYSGSTLGNAVCGIAFLILGAFYTLIAWPALGALRPAMFLDLNTMGDALTMVFVPSLLLGSGFYRMGNAICGLPRLNATPKGIELQTLRGRSWASWDSIGAFFLNRGWGYAAVIGKNAKVNLLYGRNFVIPGLFALSTPVTTIIREVNAVRAEALRRSPTLEAEVQWQEKIIGRRRMMTAVGIFVVLMSVALLVTQFHT